MNNIGYLYYKEYFKGLSFTLNGNDVKLNFNFDLTKLFDLKYSNIDFPSKIYQDNDTIELITIYPGLLIGSGYNHEIGKMDNELKLGFFFDHTTGLPCIPGSSVKGVLRDVCTKDDGKYILSIIFELAKSIRKSEVGNKAKEFYCKREHRYFLLKKEKQKYSDFVMRVFEGKKNKEDYLPISKRDIFFDAFPIESKGKFLANDYITHHEDPLKNPNPVQFLKVLPQVTFRFDFKLTDKGMDKDLKLELFKQILLDLGIGAKTNVGYGQFTNALKTDMNNSEKDIKSQHQKGNSSTKMQNIPFGVKLNKNEILDAKIIDIIGDYYRFGFNKDDNDCIVSKKEASVYKKFDKNTKLEKGDKVIIKIQSVDDLQFQVLPEEKSS